MPRQIGQSLLWRDAIVFDGLHTLAEPMVVRVDGDRISGVWPVSARV